MRNVFFLCVSQRGQRTDIESRSPYRHNPNIWDAMKICTRCGKTKPNRAFLERNDRGGLYAWCKKCMRIEGRLVETYHSKLQKATGYIR